MNGNDGKQMEKVRINTQEQHQQKMNKENRKKKLEFYLIGGHTELSDSQSACVASPRFL